MCEKHLDEKVWLTSSHDKIRLGVSRAFFNLQTEPICSLAECADYDVTVATYDSQYHTVAR